MDVGERKAAQLMTSSEFTALRALAAFLMAGSYVAVMARAAERFGSKIGGILLALPSTILVGISFIAWQSGHSGMRQAAAVLPTTIAAATIFLTIFVRLARWGLIVAYAGATAGWLAITLPLAAFHVHNAYGTAAVGILLLAIATTSFWRTPHRAARPVKQSAHLYIIRFVVAGSVAGATVIVARTAGPLWGAVCASFPAVFAAALFLMVRAQGLAFTASVGRTMIVGNMANVMFVLSIYVISAWEPSGTTIALSYLCSLLFAAMSFRFVVDALGSSRSRLPALPSD